MIIIIIVALESLKKQLKDIKERPPAEIPNIDVAVRDAVQNDDQFEVALIEKEPVATRPSNVPRRSSRIKNERRANFKRLF